MTQKRFTGSIYLKLLIPAIIIAGVYMFYKIKKHNFLDRGLQNLVEKKTHNLYKISYDSISVDEVGGDLYIKNLFIKGDTARQMQMIRSGDTNASKVILDIYIPLLQVVDFKTARALLSNQLQCNTIILNAPKVTLYFFPGYGKQKDETQQRQELYKQILGNLKLIQADSVAINNTEVVARDYFTKEIKFETSNTTIGLQDVLIDSTYREDTTRTLFCKEITVNSNRVRLGEKNNIAEITNLAFNTRSKIIFWSRFEYDAFKNKGFFKTILHDVTVEGIEWKGPAERSDLLIKSVVVKKGEIETLADRAGKSKNSKTNEKILSGWIKNFSLDKLLVKSFSLTSNSSDKKKQPLIIKNNSLLLKNVKLDTVARLNMSLVNKIGEGELHNDEIKFFSKDKFYTYRVSGFKINTKSRKVWIKQVAIIPAFGEAEFAKRSKVQRDRFDAKINNIECNDLDIDKLLDGGFYAASVTARNTVLKVYRDMSYPATRKSKVGSYPQQLLFKLSFPVKVNKFAALNTYVEYKERNSLSDSSGRVYFNNADVTITNISNLTPTPGAKATVGFTANFLGAMPLSGSIIFYLNDWLKGTFKTEASIPKSFDAKILNQLTEPMSLIKINSGVVDYIKCNIMADNYIANGTVIMTYHDFKISVQKKKGEEINKNNLLTLLANTIIKNKNTADNMRVATVVNKRDTTRSFFNFIWKSIFIGGQQTLGVKPARK